MKDSRLNVSGALWWFQIFPSFKISVQKMGGRPAEQEHLFWRDMTEQMQRDHDAASMQLEQAKHKLKIITNKIQRRRKNQTEQLVQVKIEVEQREKLLDAAKKLMRQLSARVRGLELELEFLKPAAPVQTIKLNEEQFQQSVTRQHKAAKVAKKKLEEQIEQTRLSDVEKSRRGAVPLTTKQIKQLGERLHDYYATRKKAELKALREEARQSNGPKKRKHERAKKKSILENNVNNTIDTTPNLTTGQNDEQSAVSQVEGMAIESTGAKQDKLAATESSSSAPPEKSNSSAMGPSTSAPQPMPVGTEIVHPFKAQEPSVTSQSSKEEHTAQFADTSSTLAKESASAELKADKKKKSQQAKHVKQTTTHNEALDPPSIAEELTNAVPESVTQSAGPITASVAKPVEKSTQSVEKSTTGSANESAQPAEKPVPGVIATPTLNENEKDVAPASQTTDTAPESTALPTDAAPGIAPLPTEAAPGYTAKPSTVPASNTGKSTPKVLPSLAAKSLPSGTAKSLPPVADPGPK